MSGRLGHIVFAAFIILTSRGASKAILGAVESAYAAGLCAAPGAVLVATSVLPLMFLTATVALGIGYAGAELLYGHGPLLRGGSQ